MNAQDISPKWVVHVWLDRERPAVWLSWSSLAELLEEATELATEPNTFARVPFSEATLGTLGQLLSHVEACHAAHERFEKLQCQMPTGPLARAVNELHARSTTLAKELAHPAFTSGLSREQLKTRRSLCATWNWIQRRLEADADLRAPVAECPGPVELTLHWGW